MKKYLPILIIGIAIFGFVQQAPRFFPWLPFFGSELSSSDRAIDTAYKNKQSHFQVGGSGKVIKLLSDDTQGKRHQKFLIRLNSGQTLLISHNIGIAPRIDTLKPGDHLNFYGEYEWNENGGVVHWTHHDPDNRHADGWLNHNGKLYQ